MNGSPFGTLYHLVTKQHELVQIRLACLTSPGIENPWKTLQCNYVGAVLPVAPPLGGSSRILLRLQRCSHCFYLLHMLFVHDTNLLLLRLMLLSLLLLQRTMLLLLPLGIKLKEQTIIHINNSPIQGSAQNL